MAPTCTYEGEKHTVYSCTVCGEEVRTDIEYLPKVAHSYADGFCSVCGVDEPGKKFYLVSELELGDRLVIYHPASGTAMSVTPNGTALSAVPVTVEDGVLYYQETVATLEVLLYAWQEYPLGFMDSMGYFLTSGEGRNTLFIDYEGSDVSDYAYWKAIPVSGEEGTFRLVNQSAAYNGTAQALEYYNGKFTVYDAKETDPYVFQFYSANEPSCTHNWLTGGYTSQPTCTEEGSQLLNCEFCGTSKTVTVAPLGHSYVAGTPVAPTCTEEGYTPYVCSVCSDEKKEDVQPALGHSWIPATCDSPSVCEDCDEIGGAYLAVTELAELTDGDSVILAVPGEDGYLAMSTTLTSGKFDPLSLTGSSSHLNNEGTAPEFTLVQVEGGFALYSSQGYLAYNSSTNFKYSEEPYAWVISQSETGFNILSAATNRGILYRISGGKFGAYATSNLTNSDYAGDLLIYKYAEGATLSHWDENADNLCDGCGNYIKEVALLSRSISLNGNIGVNFYMSLADHVSADENAYMLFTQEGKDSVKVSLQESVARKVKGATAYGFTYEVSAKEMTDTITLQFFYGEGKSSDVYTYSVKEYADNQRNNLADRESLMNLLDAMLRYGAASQIQFNYHTERLADQGMEPVELSAPSTEAFPTNLPQGTELVSFAGASLLLQSETTLRLFLRAGASAEDFTVTYEGVALEIKTRSGLYYVDVENISAPDLDMTFTVTVDDGTNTADISYSPLAYCASVYKNASGIHTEELRKVVATLSMYNEAANAYFTPAT